MAAKEAKDSKRSIPTAYIAGVLTLVLMGIASTPRLTTCRR